jgi:glucose dehydrogenase
VWQFDLPAGRGYANPVAYRGANGVQYIVVATGGGDNAELVAFSLDGKR